MKKILSVVLCLGLLLTAAFAEGTDEVSDLSFLLKIHDLSDLNIAYLRIDVWEKTEEEYEYTGFILSSPDEGEDFYCFPVAVDDPAYLNSMRFDLSYGVSGLDPEDAMLNVMMGNPAEEYPLLTLDFVPECGQTYDRALVAAPDGGWSLALYAGTDTPGISPESAGVSAPTREYFETVDRSRLFDEVVAEIGLPDRETGSGFPTYVWLLEDGWEAKVVFDFVNESGIDSIIFSKEGTEPEIVWFR